MKFVTGITETGRLELAELKSGTYFGKEITVHGAVHANRPMGGGLTFLTLRKKDGVLQCVCDGAVDVSGIPEESAVIVTGVLREEERAPGGMEVHVSGFSFTGQAVLGYKPRWGYATDKVNTPTEWIAENSQFTISPASVKAENTWVEDKVCGLTWLSNSNGIDEYGRQWHLEEYLETDPAHFDRHYTAKRWRLTVRYRAVAEYSLADDERQFYVGWNEEENRYEFRVSAYMTKHSSFYEDDILINDGNKSYVTTVATGLNGYFYADQP